MERKLKILFLVSNDHYTDQRMQRICATIHKKGHSVVLAGRDSANPQLIFPYNVSLIKLRYTQGPKFYYELMRKQIKFGKQLQGVDIVSSVDADTLLAAKAVAKYHNAKHVHDAHEWFTEVPELIGRPLKKWLWSKIEMFVLKHVDSMYTVSEGLAEYYQTCTNVPVKLVKNYPYARTCPNSIEKEYDIIYQGALNKGRCLDLLLEVCKTKGFNVCICGEGDLFIELKHKFGNLANIHFLGNIQSEKLHLETCKAKIGYNMLDNSSLSYNESLPNKTFDYINAEIPQIISNSKALSVLNSTCTFAVHSYLDQESLAEKISILLSDQKLYNQLGSNIKKLKQEMNWEKEEAQLLTIYEQF